VPATGRPATCLLVGVLVAATVATTGCSAGQTTTTHRSPTPPDAGAVRIVRVVDGDTVWGEGRGRRVVKVRLALADAPEVTATRFGRPECGGAQATRELRRLAYGRTARLRRPGGEGRDRFGREVAELVVDGRSVDERLVRTGWARPYRVPGRDGGTAANRRIQAAAAEARATGAGVWSRCGGFGRPAGS
jgi:endonuclease YncB( thermonuclease family)